MGLEFLQRLLSTLTGKPCDLVYEARKEESLQALGLHEAESAPVVSPAVGHGARKAVS